MNYHAARIMGFLYVSDIFDGNIYFYCLAQRNALFDGLFRPLGEP
jgi:hypothetical protein